MGGARNHKSPLSDQDPAPTQPLLLTWQICDLAWFTSGPQSFSGSSRHGNKGWQIPNETIFTDLPGHCDQHRKEWLVTKDLRF